MDLKGGVMRGLMRVSEGLEGLKRGVTRGLMRVSEGVNEGFNEGWVS